MKLSLIVAMSLNGVIGRDGQLPWKLKDDLRFFKKTTMGKPIIMGRKTFESIGSPLPGRTNIVVSRTPGYTWIDPKGQKKIWVCDSFYEAVEFAMSHVEEEAVVIGGRSIYDAALSYGVDRMYVSHVDCAIVGDTYFPPIDWSLWKEVGWNCRFIKNSVNDFSFYTVGYERRVK